jgi:GINS complex subunit 4
MKALIDIYLPGGQIDRHPIYYRQRLLAQLTPDEEQPQLSTLEAQYLEAHQALLSAHYRSCFLSLFPANLQKLDDTSGGPSIVDAPDGDAAVFCRVLRDCYAERPVFGGIELSRGDIWVLRWSTIAESVRRGDVELI